MKVKDFMYLSIACLTAFFYIVIGILLVKKLTEKPSGTVVETSETTVDTIPYCAPMPQSELALGTHLYTLPTYRFLGGGAGGEPRPRPQHQAQQKDSTRIDTIAHKDKPFGSGAGGEPRCCSDSAIVELPIIQRHYADSTYEAWVSGPVDPRLDSVRVFAPTTIITKQEWKPPKRWHIGITAGYGYGSKGFQPYIGVGITYSLFSF